MMRKPVIPLNSTLRRLVCVPVAMLAVGCAPPAHSTAQPVQAAGRPAPEEIAPDSLARLLLADVHAVEPSIIVDARYATPNNFTGAPLPGYEANRVLLRREAVAALARAQRRALLQGYSLKVFDGYRPVRATLAMVDWTERVGRQDLIRDGYIAARSRHNLGLAIDLTLVSLADSAEIDMGTPYDTFSAAAHTANASGVVAQNRATLVRLLRAEGFTNYDKEWWHFSYEAPDPRRFDLVIR